MITARSPYALAAARALAVSLALSSASVAEPPQPATPQPLPEHTALAEALFKQARDLVKEARYAEACPKLAESQRLEPKLGTLLNLAVCHEKLGAIATAWAEYTSAATIARREGSKEREEFARDQVAALEKKLARVTFQARALPPDLRLTLDDQPLDRAALNASLPINPGKHRLTATAPGKTAWSTVIDVPSEHADLVVAIPALVAESAPAPPPSAAITPPPVIAAPLAVRPPPQPVEAPPSPRNDARLLMYGGFGLGAAGVLVGAITGIVTLARASDIRAQCHNDRCAADQTEALASATTLANVSNTSLLLGAVGAGAGLGGLLWSRSLAPSTGTTVAITPTVGAGVLGLRGSF